MIPFEQAVSIVMEAIPRVGTERVALAEVLGRVLAQEVRTDMDFPPFDKACMDGYACRKEDLGKPLTVLETVPAGKVPERNVDPGQCSKIMTGAMMPEGADVVFMVEYAREDSDGRVRFAGEESAPNVALRGEDLSRGDPVLAAGTLLGPRHVAVLASVGCDRPLVSARPRVGIIATGDELVEPGEAPAAGTIRNSNSHQLAAQVLRAGATPRYYGIARDDEADIGGKLQAAMADSDVVLLSGGVSMGDFDLVPGIMRRLGLDIRFDRVAVKPGKPVTFARGADAVCFGMPGNPVSTYVIFEVFVRPFLLAMMGSADRPREHLVPLAAPLVRRRTDRLEFVPVRLDETGRALPVRYHGSAHFFAISIADGLVAMPQGVARLEQDALVTVREI